MIGVASLHGGPRNCSKDSVRHMEALWGNTAEEREPLSAKCISGTSEKKKGRSYGRMVNRAICTMYREEEQQKY